MKKEIIIGIAGAFIGAAATKITEEIKKRASKTLDETETTESVGATTYQYKVSFIDGSSVYFTTAYRVEQKIIDKIGKQPVDDRKCQRMIDMLASYHIFPISFRYYLAEEAA
jgi:ABC-type Zn uptake system ZnuABC Zn-binding protein ZnuA